MTMDGFFPKNHFGQSVTWFDSLSDVLPIITFVLSLFASSYGMTKYIINGPVSIASKESTKNGNPIINAIGLILLNLMFSFRIVAIEAIFFSYYQSYSNDFNQHKTFPPLVVQDELRLFYYLLPCLLPIIINNFRLACTYHGCRKLYLQHPQIFLAPGFTPFMYEGIENVAEYHKNPIKIKIWLTCKY